MPDTIHALPFPDLPKVPRGNRIVNHLIASKKIGARNIHSGITKLAPGASVPRHTHNAEEQVTVLRGRLRIRMEEREVECGPFDSTFITSGVAHDFANIGDDHDERRTLIASIGAAVDGRAGLNVGVGVGAVSTKQVIENAKHAQDHGATCLMIEMQQYFPIPAAGIYQHYAEIAEAVALPIRLYNLLVPTRVDMTPSTLCKMGSIAAIRSVKDASGDVERLQQIREACGDRFTLYCGLHFQLLDGMRMGADGWEVMLHPLIAPNLVRLFRTVSAAPSSSAAAAHFERWLPVFRCFRQHGVPQSIKALSRRTPMPAGSMRRPQADLSTALQDEVWSLTREALG